MSRSPLAAGANGQGGAALEYALGAGLVSLEGKRLLVLAGADVHSKVVRAARELGVYTIVTDYLDPSQSPAKRIADEYWAVDINDIDEIVRRCRETRVDGVLNFCIDPAQKPYQRICEQLGVPCYGTAEQIESLTNKALFKELCGQVGLKTVPSYSEEDVRVGAVEYPLFVKPSESRGSRGQSVCRDVEEAQRAIALAKAESADGMAVIERFMGGFQDFSLSYVVIDGEPYLLKAGDRTLGREEDGLGRQHIMTLAPSLQVRSYKEKTEPGVRRLVDVLGMRFGTLFFQGFIDDGEVYFYDPGMRLPGGDFDVVVRNVVGFDAMKTMVTFALTGNPTSCWGDPANAYMLHEGLCVILSVAVRPGIIGSIEGLDRISNDPRVHSATKRRDVGDAIPQSGDIRQRAAEFVAYLPGRYALADFIDFVYSALSIRDEDGEDMIVSRIVVDGDCIVVR